LPFNAAMNMKITRQAASVMLLPGLLAGCGSANWRSEPKARIALSEPGSKGLARCSSPLGVATVTEADTITL
jgi:hypothetical protein